MADPTHDEPLSQMNDLTLETGDPAVASAETAHPDPITGAPGAHPAAVGVGALSAGAVGAAIGAIAGPVGMVIGAAIGAFAGGLTGHEVAVSNEDAAPTGDLNPEANGTATDEEGRPSSVTGTPVPIGGSPLMMPGYDVGLPMATIQPETPVDDGSDTVTDGVSFSPAAAAARGAGEYREFAAGNALSTPPAGEEPASPAVGGASFGGSAAGTGPTQSALASEFASDSVVSEPAGAHAFGAPGSGGVLEEAAVSETAKTDAPDEQGNGGFSVGQDTFGTVRTAAYYRYLDRLESGQPGNELDDWTAAEREIVRF